MAGYGVLAGLLGGLGGFTQQTAAALEQERRDKLVRDKLDQEQQARDAQLTLERDKLAQTGPIDVSSLPPQTQALLLQGGAPAKIDPRLLPMYQKASEQAQARATGGQVANEIDAQFPPNDIQGPTRTGEPIGLQPTMPSNMVMLTKLLRAGMLGEKPAEVLAQAFPKPEMKEVQDETGARFTQPFDPRTGQPVLGSQRTPLGPSPMDLINYLNKSQGAGGGAGTRFVPSIGKDSSVTFGPEPPNYQYVRGALAEAGWSPEMPGYNTEFTTQLQQPVPTPAGGRATSRTEGIRPPSFYAAGAGGATAQPGEPTTPRFRGEPGIVPDAVAKDVMTAMQMRDSVNQIGQALKDPATANYIGPYAQYRDTVQGKAPNELLGKIPPAVVQLDANLHALQNYTIRLITGAQMNKDEVPRIMGQLPQRGNQADEFRQRVKMSMGNVSMMEDRIRALALQGDTNAKLLATELGLDTFREVQMPARVNGAPVPNRGATVPPKLPPGALWRNGQVVSEDGLYVWDGKAWQNK